jgi:hypothetical protein
VTGVIPEVVTIAVEGTTDAVVLKRLLAEVGLSCGPEYVTSGKSALDHSLAGYNNAARFSCWLVLRDLDHDAACAPQLRRLLLPSSAAHMRLHIPVHSVEAWLLADHEAFARFFAVARTRVPTDPEAIAQPKLALVNLARVSRKKFVREAVVPVPGTTARLGPGYVPLLIRFASQEWRPAVAADRCESLARLRQFLRLASRGGQGSQD